MVSEDGQSYQLLIIAFVFRLNNLRSCSLLARGVGRNLPMGRKFRNSSNSAEFGALALLDFLPFVNTKP